MQVSHFSDVKCGTAAENLWWWVVLEQTILPLINFSRGLQAWCWQVIPWFIANGASVFSLMQEGWALSSTLTAGVQANSAYLTTLIVAEGVITRVEFTELTGSHSRNTRLQINLKT